MYNINEFRITAYNALINKSQTGNSISDDQVPTKSQFNLLANTAMLSAYESDYMVWLKSGGANLTQFLQSYIKSQILMLPASGILPFPSDFQHTASVGVYYNNSEEGIVTAEPVTNTDKRNVFFSQKYTPNYLFPKYTEYAEKYEFSPKDLGVVYLDYFKTPKFATWGYSEVDDAPVYNPLTSVDFEFDEYSAPRIIGEFIKLVGINLKDKELIAYGENYAKENTMQ